jgi:hypothetical protein
MFANALSLILFGVAPAWAADDPALSSEASAPAASAAATDAVVAETPELAKARAEFVRLEREIEKLSSRNAWVGVERAYQDLVATGLPVQFQDFVAGAYAARALGDVGAARDRLLAANAIREDRSVIDWLFQIDSTYGAVALDGDPGVELVEEALPFETDQARAVQYAKERVKETGAFHGYLPPGRYTFAGHTLDIRPRIQAVTIDLRSEETLRVRAKKKKK